MKKNLFLVTAVCGFLYIILSAHKIGPASAAGLDCTGVVGTGGCGGPTCHGTVPSTEIIDSIYVLDDSGHVVNYYVPGKIYTFRIRGYNNSTAILPKFGFQLTVVKHGTDSSVGTLIGAPPITHVTYVTPRLVVAEHMQPRWCSGAGGFGSIYQVDVQWLAPSADTIELRAIVNAVDTNGTAGPEDLWSAPGAPLLVHEGHPPTIFGPKKVCVGATVPISHTPTGGTWTSSDTSIATVVAPGNVTGISPGTFNLSYTTVNGTASVIFTVNPVPAPIFGVPSICLDGTSTLSDSIAGGTWNSSNPFVATVSSGGIVAGISTGTTFISYTFSSTGCGVKKTVTVNVCPEGITNSFAQTNELLIFPNPNNGSFSVNVLDRVDDEAYIVITNVVGAKVREFTIRTNEANDIMLNQPAGTYFLSATTLTSKHFFKIVVQ